jgi:peptidoglycan/xylan/chitin deacetylase (PgdA/CDA1 family)
LKRPALALALMVACVAPAAWAGGPAAVATIDRGLWPDPVRSRAAFDRASRAEILVFAHELEAALAAQPATDSVQRWLAKLRPLLVENLRLALRSCTGPQDLGCGGPAPTAQTLGARAQAFVAHVPHDFEPWLATATAFHRTYAAEQLRLAALFPRITSEVMTFDGRERNGWELPDREFVLTFDDGPTAAAGNTDKTLQALQTEKLTGFFFVLGENLGRRRQATSDEAVRALYRGQCLASHGQIHKSHQKMPDWRASVDGTRDAIRSVLGAPAAPVFFRPPYGQRSAELAAYAPGSGSPVMLWNLDSQDWNAHMAADAIPDRMITLMALWRRGILLFHDVHPKVFRALPALGLFARTTGLRFRDCHEITALP